MSNYSGKIKHMWYALHNIGFVWLEQMFMYFMWTPITVIALFCFISRVEVLLTFSVLFYLLPG